jgi:biotin operon repressor
MKKIEFGSDEQFIENYQKLKSAQKMGELYGCSKTTILKHAKDIGYDVNTNKEYKLSTQDKEEILAAYTQNITSTELAKKYNVPRGMITKIWSDAGLSGKQKTITKNIFQEGDRINHLTILRKTDARNASGCIMWECLCDCGKIASVSSARLKSGAAKSCGCLSKKSLELGRG